MTNCATNVHKCLCDGYIDALFRRILTPDLGINGCICGFPCYSFGYRQSDFVEFPGALTARWQGTKACPGVICDSFLLTHFPSPVQSVSIRGVSTKLKVNSGRTNPPGQPSPWKLSPNKRDRPPRWFPGISCANTAFESKAKGVAKRYYSDRTNLQIDQDLHPGPRTFALDVLPALLSTYLPAQARKNS